MRKILKILLIVSFGSGLSPTWDGFYHFRSISGYDRSNWSQIQHSGTGFRVWSALDHKMGARINEENSY